MREYLEHCTPQTESIIDAAVQSVLATIDASSEAAPENATDAKKVKRTRKTKDVPFLEPVHTLQSDDAPEEKKADETTPAVNLAPALVAAPSLDDLRVKLQEIAGKVGIAGATEVLRKFKVHKVSALDPKDFGLVLAECEKVLG